jgi:hypothetical protein
MENVADSSDSIKFDAQGSEARPTKLIESISSFVNKYIDIVAIL